ncbi:hypothetical protein VTO73DRAFT_6305 [Trametes versicolor]
MFDNLSSVMSTEALLCCVPGSEARYNHERFNAEQMGDEPGLPQAFGLRTSVANTGALGLWQRPRLNLESSPAAGVLTDPRPSTGDSRLQDYEIRKLLEDRRMIYSKQDKDKAWAHVAGEVKKHSDNMVEGFLKLIDTYLVFAGLLSAIITTFNVQTYQLLQPSTPDQGAPNSIPIALQQISLQLRSFAISPPFVNSTHPASAAAPIRVSSTASSPVPRYAILLNVLWFSSLMLSLQATVSCILSKQNLSKYNSPLTGNSREMVRLCQHRLNELRKAHLDFGVDMISNRLLMSLCFFLIGLIILLWTLNHQVAILPMALAVIFGVQIFSMFVTSMMSMNPVIFDFAKGIGGVLGGRLLVSVLSPPSSIRGVDHRESIHWYRDLRALGTPGFVPAISQILAQLSRTLVQVSRSNAWEWSQARAAQALGRGIRTPSVGTRSGHERSVVNQSNGKLDLDILINAYELALDTDMLSSVSIILLDQRIEFVLDYFVQLDRVVTHHFGAEDCWDRPQDALLVTQVLLCALHGTRKTIDGLLLAKLRERVASIKIVPGSGFSRCATATGPATLPGPNASSLFKVLYRNTHRCQRSTDEAFQCLQHAQASAPDISIQLLIQYLDSVHKLLLCASPILANLGTSAFTSDTYRDTSTAISNLLGFLDNLHLGNDIRPVVARYFWLLCAILEFAEGVPAYNVTPQLLRICETLNEYLKQEYPTMSLQASLLGDSRHLEKFQLTVLRFKTSQTSQPEGV